MLKRKSAAKQKQRANLINHSNVKFCQNKSLRKFYCNVAESKLLLSKLTKQKMRIEQNFEFLCFVYCV